MALKDAVEVFGRQAPLLDRLRDRLAGLESYRLALADTARSLQRTHATLPRTRPLTGHPGADAAVADTLAAFPAALIRLTATGAAVDHRATPFEPASAGRRTATPTEAVAGGVASLQRLGLRARLYADEILQARIHLVEPEHVAWRAISPLASLLREFGQQCDALSFHLRPARLQMEEALEGLDRIGAGHGTLTHFTRSDGDGDTAVHTAGAFLAAHPQHRAAFTAQVGRATAAYAHAEASRDKLVQGLKAIRDSVDAL